MVMVTRLLILGICLVSYLALAKDIHPRMQKVILENAPQIDSNKDGKISFTEIQKAYPELPSKQQNFLRKRFPGIAGDQQDNNADNRKNNTKQAKTGSFQFDRDAGDPEVGRKKGFNCLFLGHSFFCPIVKHIDAHAKALGLENHQQYVGMSGGAGGSPGKLWASTKSNIVHAKELLKSGKVELLAMTGHYIGSTIEDYSKWIDLALKHNPKTIIVLQSPWNIKNNKKFPEYAESVKTNTKKSQSMVDQLRKKYPDTTFQLIPQGTWMVSLWEQYETKNIPELTQLVGKGKGKSDKALFRDNFGHGGTMAEKEGSLLWLPILYGTDLNNYDYSTNTKFDIKAMVQKIYENEPYAKLK